MHVFSSIAEINFFLEQSSNRSKKRILVPTMGALHKGHFSLIKQAKKIALDDATVIVSIFVNPKQFNDSKDFDNYPNTLKQDLQACKDLGVDVVFTPIIDTIYNSDHSITILEKSLSKQLCGASRPGHFDGVCTIVLKLFQISQATDAIFGKKDFQQLSIIKRMVRDLNLPIQIHAAQTIRETNGLALSSRNHRLTEENTQLAPFLQQSLQLAKHSYLNGNTNAHNLCKIASDFIFSKIPQAKIDYLSCVNQDDLQLAEVIKKPTIMALAVFLGDVRLIDNIEL